VNVDALWHYLECGAYSEDLALWRMLASKADGPVLDVGAGTGRVTVELATAGVEMVALDAEAALLDALDRRASGLPVETVVADARRFSLGRRFALVVVPMQTLQLFGGPGGRLAFLTRALDHLESGGRLAAALADPFECFDEAHDLPPPPAACEVGGVRYASQLVAVSEENGRAALQRVRTTVPSLGHEETKSVVLQLDRVSADDVAIEAAEVGFLREPDLHVPETEEYLGSTVVVLRAP